MPGHEDIFDKELREEQEVRARAARDARVPLEDRLGRGDIRNREDAVDLAREQEAQRWEAIADKQLEAAQTMERVVEEFASQVQNFESAMAKDRRARKEYS